MFSKSPVREHMEVADIDGRHIGTVDKVEDGMIKLARRDTADNLHHYLPLSAVDRVEDGRVILKRGTDIPVGIPA